MDEYTGIREIDRWIHRADVQVNNCGNVEQRVQHFDERGLFDYRLDRETWKPFKTRFDRWNFGVWVNPTELRLVKYDDGDITYTQCCHADGYNREIAYLCAADYATDQNSATRVEVAPDGSVTIIETFPGRGEFFVPTEG